MTVAGEAMRLQVRDVDVIDRQAVGLRHGRVHGDSLGFDGVTRFGAPSGASEKSFAPAAADGWGNSIGGGG